MRIAMLFGVALALVATSLQAQQYYQGYTTRNGTYVAPHYQSNPNGTKLDNYSTRGNTNPYTGQAGTANPYPTYSAPSHGAQRPSNCRSNPYQIGC